MRAIILAGGKGTRLKPYTTLIPKPLVPIGGDKSILEIVIHQLSIHGFKHITLAVNHLAHLVMSYFGDGSRWGIKIDYSLEEQPLSTIGPLTLLNDLPEDFLVMNGDILCNLDYQRFFEDHVRNRSAISISSYKRETKIDFGVLLLDDGGHLVGFREKPTYHFDVSMGIYCINRSIIEKLPKGRPYGFDDLMRDSIARKENVWIHGFDKFWLDIGRPEDYEYADKNYSEIKTLLGL
jgi:NDP-sugar pyrophosphorylase family protein